MRTTDQDVIHAFERVRNYNSNEAKVRAVRYYLEQDGTFQLPRSVVVCDEDYLEPDVLIDRLVRELKEESARAERDVEEFMEKYPSDSE
jgi:hypothetical protein